MRRLAAELRDHTAIDEAFLATSFGDHLVIVDVSDGEHVPSDVSELLADHGLHGARTRGDDSDDTNSSVGRVGNGTRHHFLDGDPTDGPR